MRSLALTIACGLLAAPAWAQTGGESPAARAAAAEARLEAAYKKEFAFLDAEKAALNRRLGEVRRAADGEAARARAELERMQRRLVALTVEADQLGETLIELERQADVAGEGLDALDGLVQQMARSFEGHVDWPPAALAVTAPQAPTGSKTGPDTQQNSPPVAPGDAGGADQAPVKGTDAENADPTPAGAAEAAAATVERYAALLADGFERAGPLMQRQGAVRVEPGAFFTADGRQVSGSLVRVGGIAVYGVGDGAGAPAGALTPAGGGRFKLDPPRGEATARALAAGAPPPTADVFLYESAAENYEPPQAKTPLQVIEAGGAIAWVIVGLGGLGLLLIVLRALLLVLARSPAGLVDRVAPLVKAGRHAEAADTCAAARGSGARVLSAIARHLKADREDLERVFAERMLAEENRIDRFGSALLVIAAVAPLLGLLGTVTGMISTFDVITEFGTGNPKLLSGGISEALITTELGLIVAIPTLLVGNLLNGWAGGLKSAVEQSALRLVNIARVGEEERPSGGRRTPVEAADTVPGSAPDDAAPVPA